MSEELDRKVKDMVRYAVCCRNGVIRREDLSKKVMKDNPRMFKAVFDDAQKHLREVFGMEMAPLPQKEQPRTRSSSQMSLSQSTQASAASATTSYVLRNVLPPPRRPNVMQTQQEAPELGLLLVILALILTSNRAIAEPQLVRYLSSLTIHVGGDDAPAHETFGKVNQVLDNFVKHLYLEKTKPVANSAQQHPDYRWGPRAKVEMEEKAVLQFIREVYGTDMPDSTFNKLVRSVESDAAQAD